MCLIHITLFLFSTFENGNGIAWSILTAVHTCVSILNVLQTAVYGNTNCISILTCS